MRPADGHEGTWESYTSKLRIKIDAHLITLSLPLDEGAFIWMNSSLSPSPFSYFTIFPCIFVTSITHSSRYRISRSFYLCFVLCAYNEKEEERKKQEMKQNSSLLNLISWWWWLIRTR